jgi:hypothetical protein
LRGKALKRSAVLITILVAVALLGGALAGCGGEESKARGYLETAHSEGLKVTKNIDKLSKKEKELTRLYQKTGQVTPENLESVRKPYLELVELIGAVKVTAEETKGEYEKVLELKDVEKYKDFANMQIKALDLLAKQMELMGDYYSVFNKVAEDQAAGRPIDEAAVNSQIGKVSAELVRVVQDIQKAKKDAADIGDELNLEWLKAEK